MVISIQMVPLHDEAPTAANMADGLFQIITQTVSATPPSNIIDFPQQLANVGSLPTPIKFDDTVKDTEIIPEIYGYDNSFRTLSIVLENLTRALRVPSRITRDIYDDKEEEQAIQNFFNLNKKRLAVLAKKVLTNGQVIYELAKNKARDNTKTLARNAREEVQGNFIYNVERNALSYFDRIVNGLLEP